MVKLNICIHAPDVNKHPLTGDELRQLNLWGLQNMRIYGGDKAQTKTAYRYMLLEFDIINYNKIGAIVDLLDKHELTLCFRNQCPKLDGGCPAFRP